MPTRNPSENRHGLPFFFAPKIMGRTMNPALLLQYTGLTWWRLPPFALEVVCVDQNSKDELTVPSTVQYDP